MAHYTEVAKEEFWEVIGPRDVASTIVGPYPYATVFKMRNGRVVGKIVTHLEQGARWIDTTYYLAKPFEQGSAIYGIQHTQSDRQGNRGNPQRRRRTWLLRLQN